MAFLNTTDLNTHMREYNIATIDEGDSTILQAAIDSAIAEAKGYLYAYDIDVIFSATGTDRNAMLLGVVKDIAVWRFIILMNAGVELQHRKDLYYIARDWLKAVQKGDIKPDLPKLKDEETGQEAEPIISYGSNPKRRNHF